jgi:hypothetical protein
MDEFLQYLYSYWFQIMVFIMLGYVIKRLHRMEAREERRDKFLYDLFRKLGARASGD